MTSVRKSTPYLIFTALSGVALGILLWLHPAFSGRHHQEALDLKRKLVQELRLTDLCLFTEARYTRHLSQADLYSAFQDHPLALEHFPSGSIVRPPVSLWAKQLDGSSQKEMRVDQKK